VEAVNPYGREVEDFSRAVRGGPAPRLGRDDALGQARTIEALYRSADEGCAVAL
jgi:predicted dehydrogenase